jgi:hypothetical protein
MNKNKTVDEATKVVLSTAFRKAIQERFLAAIKELNLSPAAEKDLLVASGKASMRRLGRVFAECNLWHAPVKKPLSAAEENLLAAVNEVMQEGFLAAIKELNLFSAANETTLRLLMTSIEEVNFLFTVEERLLVAIKKVNLLTATNENLLAAIKKVNLLPTLGVVKKAILEGFLVAINEENLLPAVKKAIQKGFLVAIKEKDLLLVIQDEGLVEYNDSMLEGGFRGHEGTS